MSYRAVRQLLVAPAPESLEQMMKTAQALDIDACVAPPLA